MKHEAFVKSVVRWAAEQGYGVRESYSGRGMFGRTCLGVVVPSMRDIAQLYYDLGWEAHELAVENNSYESCEQLPTFEWDSMGRSDIIVYWRDCSIAPAEWKQLQEPDGC